MDDGTFESVEAFFQADERRRHSPEVDYGVMWTGASLWPLYRVSWIAATGEFYAVRLKAGDDRVELLGHAATRKEADRALEGWAGQTFLSWVRERLRMRDVPTVAEAES